MPSPRRLFTGDLSRTITILIAKCNVCIISGCLLCIRPLITIVFPQYFSGSSARRSKSSSPIGENSWRMSTFNRRNDNSFRLNSAGNLERNKSYSPSHAKHAGNSRSWLIGRQDGAEIDAMPKNGIWISKDVRVDDDEPSRADEVATEGSSKEWNIKSVSKEVDSKFNLSYLHLQSCYRDMWAVLPIWLPWPYLPPLA